MWQQKGKRTSLTLCFMYHSPADKQLTGIFATTVRPSLFISSPNKGQQRVRP